MDDQFNLTIRCKNLLTACVHTYKQTLEESTHQLHASTYTTDVHTRPRAVYVPINNEEVFSWLRGKSIMTFATLKEDCKQKEK